MKNNQKNSIYPSVSFSCMKNQPIHVVYMKTHLWHLKGLNLELHLNLWFKWTSSKLNAKCISSKHITFSCHVQASYCCIWLCLISTLFLLDRSYSGDRSRVPIWGAVPSLLIYQASKPPCSFWYDPTLSLLLSFIALGQPQINCYFMLR